MSAGLRIRRTFQRPPAEAVAELSTYPTANLSDCMGRFFVLPPEIKPLGKTRLCGPAFTVCCSPADNLMLHKAIDMAASGDILVVDSSGSERHAVMGELIALWAQRRGVGGMVIAGLVRDAAALAALEMPVFAAGATPAGPYKDGPGEIGFPLSIGGTVVSPGDVIVGDADGVVVVPQGDVGAVLAAVRAVQKKEAQTQAEIAAGTWDRTWVDRALEEKGCEYVE